jgi:carbamoyltransferase
MIICGLKLTHDSGVALIDNGKLVFGYELEKLNNAPRYSSFNEDLLPFLDKILTRHGYTRAHVDSFVVDGWHDDVFIEAVYREKKVALAHAGYGAVIRPGEDVLKGISFLNAASGFKYRSYKHISGHIMGAYMSSPFGLKEKSSFVLVWDGGMPPQLFYFDASRRQLQYLQMLFPAIGHIYALYANLYEPFNRFDKFDLSIAGKVMAYIALGKVQPDLLDGLALMYNQVNINPHTLTTIELFNGPQFLIRKVKEMTDRMRLAPQDCLATFHKFLEQLLVSNLQKIPEQFPGLEKNLCYTGGTALNIKWNSAIRNSGPFAQVWIPPFPNDSGSAIGTACCELFNICGSIGLEWDVNTGPALVTDDQAAGWQKVSCSVELLAQLLHEQKEPVVFLTGRAELGPRSLGNRSIIAPATEPDMQQKLNEMKNREFYRPVAPICLEEDAPALFDPGVPDPYMLFDHTVREQWKDVIPAVCHLDRTARLQTINRRQNQLMYDLLSAYKGISGIPLLCNTSANFSGRGFFPDVKSAMQWGKANYIWSDHNLYFRREKELPMEKGV